MKLPAFRTSLVWVTCLGLAACDAPTLVSLQPIGAPEPANAQQTFVDADGCSWWIVGNGSDLRWAPMTNSSGEHVCDGGQTRLDRDADVANVVDEDTSFISDTRTAINDAVVPAAPEVAAPAVAVTTPAADGRQTFVQVATFAKESNAIASEKLFRSLGYGIESGAQTRDNDRLFRLILGPFSSREEAQKAVERAFAEGFDDAFPFRK